MRCPWVSYRLHHHHIKVWAGSVTERTYHFERGKHWKGLNRKIRTSFLFVLFCFFKCWSRKTEQIFTFPRFLYYYRFLSLYKISIYCHYYSAFLVHISLRVVLRTMYVTNKGSWILSCLKHLIEVASLIDPLYHLGHSWSNKYKINRKKIFPTTVKLLSERKRSLRKGL